VASVIVISTYCMLSLITVIFTIALITLTFVVSNGGNVCNVDDGHD
jgi:hypothetical protein